MTAGRGLFDDEPADAAGTQPADDHIDPDEVHARSRAAAAAEEAASTSPAQAGTGRHAAAEDADERPIPLRLAHLHLRMGSLALARAELESLAGRGMLDEASLLDLAEVRWRTGDLAGAGEAANALLTRGRGDALALVIAAESVSAQGRPGEARRLAARALESHPGPLDLLFAGIPRSLIWPADAPLPSDATTDDPGEPISPRVAAAAATSRVEAAGLSPRPASTGAAEAYAGGRAALGAGDTPQAAVRLGVALRLEPAYASEVLAAIGERAIEERAIDPALALIAGDALRLLGRESEALAAFDIARGHVHSPEEPHARGESSGEDRPPA